MHISANMTIHAILLPAVLFTTNWRYYKQAILSMIIRLNSALPKYIGAVVTRSELQKAIS
jgi:hypothetical protein